MLEQMTDRNGRAPVYRTAAVLLFAVAVGLRVYGAWAYRYITTPDSGIVALMAKHMAEGTALPLFFYGQAYMGALEPMLSALLCRLFGVSGFAVCAGTALAAAGALGMTFLWARDAGGRAGALTALACCAIGPYYYFMFQFAPRGGYMMTLLLGLAVMRASARTAAACAAGEPVSPLRFLGIGVLAGLGWWTNPLIAAALASAALVLAIGLRGRVWTAGPAAGLAGFLLGSLPYWLWNLRHDWASFQMFTSVGAVPVSEGFGLLLARYRRLIGLDGWHAAARGAVMWAYPLAAAAGTGVLLAGGVRRRRLDAPAATGIVLAAFFTLSIVFFVRSSFATFNTARYLIPLVPAAAVAVGALVAAIPAKRARAALALPLLLLLILSQWPALRTTTDRLRTWRRREASDRKLGAFLREHNLRVAYAPFKDHTLNFNLREQAVVTDMRGDRYAPYTRRAERADRIAVLGNFGQVRDFLACCGGSAEERRAGRHRVHFGFRPPAGGLREIEPAALAATGDARGVTNAAAVLDRDIDTTWMAPAGERTSRLTVALAEPRPVRVLRLYSKAAYALPRTARVDVQREPDGAWQTVLAERPVTGFYWSGPRPFWGGPRFRLEYRLDDTPVSALRIVCTAPPLSGPWSLSELQLFEPGPTPADPVAALPALYEALADARIVALHAGRWVSNKVAEHVGPPPDGIAVDLTHDAEPYRSVRWGAGTALLVRTHDAPLTGALLAEFRIPAATRDIGPWVFFALGDRPGAPETGAPLPLYWTGFNVMRCDVTAPRRPVRARFSNGAVLRGVTVAPLAAAAGDTVDVAYFWESGLAGGIAGPAVFVHFVQAGRRFQDDHLLPKGAAAHRIAGLGETGIHRYRRTVRIPADAHAGDWDLRIGLHNPSVGKRLSLRTDAPSDDEAVVFERILRVRP